MKKEIPESVLITLAKLAPKVEPEAEVKSSTHKKGANLTLRFIKDVGIKAGRNEVSASDIYNAFCEWTYEDYAVANFKKQFSKQIKLQENGTYKLNMKTITILEKIKELQHEQKK